jgi:hypothetical protein
MRRIDGSVTRQGGDVLPERGKGGRRGVRSTAGGSYLSALKRTFMAALLSMNLRAQ